MRSRGNLVGAAFHNLKATKRLWKLPSPTRTDLNMTRLGQPRPISKELREFSLGVPTRELVFGFELAHIPVNTRPREFDSRNLRFSLRKLAIFTSLPTLSSS